VLALRHLIQLNWIFSVLPKLVIRFLCPYIIVFFLFQYILMAFCQIRGQLYSLVYENCCSKILDPAALTCSCSCFCKGSIIWQTKFRLEFFSWNLAKVPILARHCNSLTCNNFRKPLLLIKLHYICFPMRGIKDLALLYLLIFLITFLLFKLQVVFLHFCLVHFNSRQYYNISGRYALFIK
jgi:hypothetical protein